MKPIVSGQVSQIADEIYNIHLKMRILEESHSAAGCKSVLVRFRLDFDNAGYIASKMEKRTYLERISLPDFHCFFLLKLFQFGVIFAEDMKILGVGEKLLSLWGFEHVLGNNITDHFRLRRPKGIPFTWKNVRVFDLDWTRVKRQSQKIVHFFRCTSVIADVWLGLSYFDYRILNFRFCTSSR